MNKTPISILQELMVQKKLCLPDYIIESVGNVNNIAFKCTVHAGGLTAVSQAPNKKDAKQESARNALEKLGYGVLNSKQNLSSLSSMQTPTVSSASFQLSPLKNQPFINYVGELNEFASIHRTDYPTYNETVDMSTEGFVVECLFVNEVTNGCGPNKKQAKQIAAQKMINRVKTLPGLPLIPQHKPIHPELECSEKLQEMISKFNELSSSGMEKCQTKTEIIEPLPNLQKNLSIEEYQTQLRDNGVAYEVKTFQRTPLVMMMKVQNNNLTLMAHGSTKNEAINDLLETAVSLLKMGISRIEDEL